MLKKVTVEAAIGAELDDHLGYDRNQPTPGSNSRNCHYSKTLYTDDGAIDIEVPRDRNSSFEPQIVKKQQTRLTGMDDKILFLYAQGMTTREICATFKEFYDADVFPSLISKVTNAVMDQVYPIVYLDCIVVKIRQDKQVINKAVYLALAVNIEGHKELLGIWLSENEGAQFYLGILTELKNRGLEDILIACVDGLKGFPEAIQAVYPDMHIQLCIVHMVRNSIKFVPCRDYKEVSADLKQVYRSSTEEEALREFDNLEEKWLSTYPQISRSWRQNWDNLDRFFA